MAILGGQLRRNNENDEVASRSFVLKGMQEKHQGNIKWNIILHGVAVFLLVDLTVTPTPAIMYHVTKIWRSQICHSVELQEFRGHSIDH